MNECHAYLFHPFTMVITGPTGSGKTRFMWNLLRQRNDIISPAPKNISYFYGEYQKEFKDLGSVKFYEGLDEINAVEYGDPHLIIIDDLMNESSKSETISDLFTKGSHHRNLSVILLVQNFFAKGAQLRNITLNAHYVILFKNPRDKTIARSIAAQMYPSKTQAFQKAYEDATQKPYSYLFIDLKPETPETLRLLSNVLGESKYITVYKI